MSDKCATINLNDISDTRNDVAEASKANIFLEKLVDTMTQEIVQISSLRDQAANIIRTMILGGELQSGDKISERHVSSILKISTTPIKEALRVLQSEGLITTVPRKGSFVTKDIKGEIVQLTFLRSAVDGVAAYFAAECATEEQITRMQRYLDEAKVIVREKGETPKLSKVNDAFHEVVREAAGSFLIVNIGANMRAIDNSIRRRVNNQDFAGALRRHKEHQNILDLIAKHKPKEAEEAMLKHIRQGIERIAY